MKHAFLVRYRVSGADEQSWSVSPLRDFNGQGARFLAERAVVVGDRLESQLLLPLSKQPLAVTARVVWAKPLRGGLAEIGITFEPGESHAQQMIDAAAAHFLERPQRPQRTGGG